jgi:hypothetical protein
MGCEDEAVVYGCVARNVLCVSGRRWLGLSGCLSVIVPRCLNKKNKKNFLTLPARSRSLTLRGSHSWDDIRPEQLPLL